jgi:hypothetical protein
MEEDLRKLVLECIATPSGNPLWPNKHLGFCEDHALSLGAFFNAFAKHVAVEFARGEMSYSDGDCAMNRLFGIADFDHFGPFAWAVYAAFDEGEYLHDGDTPSTISWQAYTLPLVMEALAAVRWQPSA